MGNLIGLGLFCSWVATGGALLAWTASPSIDAEESSRLGVGISYVMRWFIAGALGMAGFFAVLAIVGR